MTKRPHGAGHIRTRTLADGSLKHDALVRLPGGKQVLLVAADTEDQALAYLTVHAAKRAELGHTAPIDTGVLTLRQLSALYLAQLPAHKLLTDQSRWDSRIANAEFASWPLTQITERAVSRWIDTMARTPIAKGKGAGQQPSRSTLQNSLNLLRAALRWARIRGYVMSNAAEGVTIRDSTEAAPRSGKMGELFDYLREDEVQQLLTASWLPLEKRAAFITLAFAGPRPKDAYLLTWDRVRFDQGMILFRTHKKDRNYNVHMLPPVARALKQLWIANGKPTTGLVWPGEDGKEHGRGFDWGWGQIWANNSRTYKGVGERLIGRKVPLYSLRHTCASQLLLGSELFTGGRRWSLEEIASHLGHTDLSTVKHYAIALGVASKQAVEESRIALATMNVDEWPVPHYDE